MKKDQKISNAPVMIKKSSIPHLDRFHQALIEVMSEKGLVQIVS